MRTTLDLDPVVLGELRDRQKREGGTLGALVSRLLAAALDEGTSPTAAVVWPGADLGLLVDIDDADALERALSDDR